MTLTRAVEVPRLLHVAPGCLGAAAQLLVDDGFDVRTVCVGCGPGPSRALADVVIDGLRSAGVRVVTTAPLMGRLDQAAELAATIIAREVTLVLGVGGGRVIDTAKLAASRTGVDFVSVPTTIAHDGISSPVASLARDGVRGSFAATMPAGILVDVDVIASAPARTLAAGVADLASNLTAVLDWQRAAGAGADRYDAFSAMIAEGAARPVLGLDELDTPDSHAVLANGLVLSGLAMAAAGTSRPCSGAEHLISHSLDALLGDRAALHGEQVALGTLVSAAALDPALHALLHGVFTRLGVPTRPDQLGIGEDELCAAVRAAPATRPERHTILTGALAAPGAAETLVEAALAPSGVPV